MYCLKATIYHNAQTETFDLFMQKKDFYLLKENFCSNQTH